jgi:hypothetical protein
MYAHLELDGVTGTGSAGAGTVAGRPLGHALELIM